MEIGPQPGQRKPLGCQSQPPDAQAGWCGLWCQRRLRDPREQADCRAGAQTYFDVVLDPQKRRLSAVPKSVG